MADSSLILLMVLVAVASVIFAAPFLIIRVLLQTGQVRPAPGAIVTVDDDRADDEVTPALHH